MDLDGFEPSTSSMPWKHRADPTDNFTRNTGVTALPEGTVVAVVARIC